MIIQLARTYGEIFWGEDNFESPPSVDIIRRILWLVSIYGLVIILLTLIWYEI